MSNLKHFNVGKATEESGYSHRGFQSTPTYPGPAPWKYSGSIDIHVDGIAVSQGSFKSIGPRSLLTRARVALAE